jgi:two-component system chemotaxis response regulator CheY
VIGAGKKQSDVRNRGLALSKALVVDDSRAVRMILTRTLRELGYEVGEAGDGKEALGILERDPRQFQLVLVDWNMPVMNGLELLETLRSRPEFSSLLIVMVTTETELGHMATALTAGANEYVMKPFTKDILVSKLEIVGAVSNGMSS